MSGPQFFAIAWPPSAKGRPKFVRRTGVAYTPAETRSAEAAIKTLLAAQGAKLYERGLPLAVEMRFYVKRPVSSPRRVTLPTTRPDVDQYVKLLMDAASGVLWLDDAQVVAVTARKCFAGDERHPAPCQELSVWVTSE